MNPFKGPGGYGRIVNGIMNIILCVVLSFYVLWTVQNLPGNEALPILTPLGFFVSFVTTFRRWPGDRSCATRCASRTVSRGISSASASFAS